MPRPIPMPPPPPKTRARRSSRRERLAIEFQPEGPRPVAPQHYVNREMSLLAFQRRVLGEARAHDNPLLERIKFLAILGSNLDEIFMVRVAGLIAQADAGVGESGPDRTSP